MRLGPLLMILALLGPGCTQRPEDPVLDNPFDVQGPQGGDPFGLVAAPSGDQVLLTWRQPAHESIAGYNVLHGLDGIHFDQLDTVDPSTSEEVTYLHTDPAPNVTNYYKVQAFDAEGATTSISPVAADSLRTPPYLRIAGGQSRTGTRYVELTVRTLVGDTLEIATSEDFAGASFQPALPGTSLQHIPLDLGPAPGNGTDKDVYLRVHDGADVSPVAQATIKTRFQPSVEIVGDPTAVPSRTVDLDVSGDGILLMRFHTVADSLELIPWLPYSETFAGFLLRDVTGPQVIHGEFMSDFGYSVADSETVTPSLLQDVSFVLAGGADVTESRTITIQSDAPALWMRFSESPDIASARWSAYADTSEFTLSEGAGRKIVYGQFANDWATSPVGVDFVTLVHQELTVEILAPPEDSSLEGGLGYQVTGVAVPPEGVPIDSVEVDLGHGWVRAGGTERWQILWTVPQVTADSLATLVARAHADTLFATDLVKVTVRAPNP